MSFSSASIVGFEQLDVCWVVCFSSTYEIISCHWCLFLPPGKDQKRPPEVFCKKMSVLMPATLLKRYSNTAVFL